MEKNSLVPYVIEQTAKGERSYEYKNRNKQILFFAIIISFQVDMREEYKGAVEKNQNEPCN